VQVGREEGVYLASVVVQGGEQVAATYSVTIDLHTPERDLESSPVSYGAVGRPWSLGEAGEAAAAEVAVSAARMAGVLDTQGQFYLTFQVFALG